MTSLLLKNNGKFDITFVNFQRKNSSVEIQDSICFIGKIK